MGEVLRPNIVHSEAECSGSNCGISVEIVRILCLPTAKARAGESPLPGGSGTVQRMWYNVYKKDVL